MCSLAETIADHECNPLRQPSLVKEGRRAAATSWIDDYQAIFRVQYLSAAVQQRMIRPNGDDALAACIDEMKGRNTKFRQRKYSRYALK
jgi:hypothetical protein